MRTRFFAPFVVATSRPVRSEANSATRTGPGRHRARPSYARRVTAGLGAFVMAAAAMTVGLGATDSSAAPTPGVSAKGASAVPASLIRARQSGRCLDVTGGSTANGANVIQWACHDGSNQRWTLQAVGAGYYRLVVDHSDKCLDVTGGSTVNGANVIQWTCHNGFNQQWRPVYSGAGFYRFVARHSGRCLDVAGGSTANGANVIQWTCHNGFNQQWHLG
jgi:hypothetical protein